MEMIRFVRKYVVPDLMEVKGKVCISVLLLFATVVSQIGAIEAGRALIQVLQIKPANAAPSGILAIPAHRWAWDSEHLLIFCSILAVLLPLVSSGFMYARDITFERIAIRITKKFQDRLYANIVSLPYASFKETGAAVLVKRINYDAAQIRRLILDVGLFRLADIVIVGGVLIYLASLNIGLMFVSSAGLILYLVTAWICAGIAADRILAMDRCREEITGCAQESFERFLDIRANLRERSEIRRFGEITNKAAKARSWFAVVLLLDRSLTELLAAVGPVVVMVVGGWWTLSGTLPLETLLAFVAATSMIYGPLDRLSAVPMSLKELAVSIRNMEDILGREPESDGKLLPEPLTVQSVSEPPLVEVRDVEFEYPGTRRVFRYDGIKIYEGERVAVVGPSGSGKTTLLLLLFGIFRDYRGCVYFRGRDTRTFPLKDLRARMGLLLQDSFVLADTVAGNVAYGAFDGMELRDEDIMAVLDKASLAKEVAQMPDGLRTPLLHLGANLSGGQRRRLCLSRALVRKPDLLMLDEPVTGVPPAEVRSIIDTLMHDRLGVTMLICSHQPDILRAVDRSIVIDTFEEDGITVTRIQGAGTHRELLNSCSFYGKQFKDNGTENR